jgi:hypothetical protein
MPHLGCYLGLADDDRCCVLEDAPPVKSPRNKSRRAPPNQCVTLECLATFLHQGVEGGLDDAVLVKFGSIDAGASLLHA